MMFIDSNIWCYYFDSQAKEHSKVAKALEKAAEKEELLVNTVILMEVSHFLVKNLGAVRGKQHIDILLSMPIRIVSFDQSSFVAAVMALTEHTHSGIGGRDATILATMKQEGTRRLFTHDRAFRRISDVNVIDPISP